MKEININGAVMKCYPLCAAQRIHDYTIKFCPPQVLCIGTGFYFQIDIDFDALKTAIYKAYDMFDAMRLRFVKDGNGEMYQYIVPKEEREIELRDFSGWNENDAHDEMRRWTSIPFIGDNIPLNKVVMVKLPGGYNGIYLKADHRTMDSCSLIGFHVAIIEAYCAMCYGMKSTTITTPFIPQLEKDLEYEASSAAKQKDAEFWQSELNKSEPMYTDFAGQGRLLTQRRENNNPNQRWARVISKDPTAAIATYRLEEDSSKRLMMFCESNKVTMNALLLMGMRTVLSKFNDNEKDVSIKTCVSRRGSHSKKYCGGTRIHFFPLRMVMEPEMTFLDGIRMIQSEQKRIYRHADFDPIEYNSNRAKHWNIQPGSSYESMSLTYQPLMAKDALPDLPDIPYKDFWYTNGVAGQPMYLTVMHRTEDAGLNFNFEYRIDAVSEHEMEYFYYYLCRVLFRGIENENRTIGEILEMI